MDIFSSGNYLGTKIDSYKLPQIIITKAQYGSVENKGWHCHENAFFAYFLKGGNLESRKSKEIECSAGTLLFYNSLVPHCNKAYENGSRSFMLKLTRTG